MKNVTILCFVLLLLSCSAPKKENAVPKIIFDTDIGGDIDDLGALYALNVYADKGLCEIIGVMSSWPMTFHIDGIDAVNTYFGRPDIPIGVVQGELYEKNEYTWFLGERFPHDQTGTSAPKATQLYRDLLAESSDSSITIIVTGRLNNIYDLLKSVPDLASPLSGRDLIHKKVKAFFIMGGLYPASETTETNFRIGGPGVTKYVLDSCSSPMIFNGGEIGHAKLGFSTGSRINNLPEDNVLRAGYLYFFQNPPAWTRLEPSDSIADWSIWDIITVQVAIAGGKDYFDIVTKGYNTADSSGVNKWIISPDKNHTYLVKKMDPQKYADSVIEQLLLTEAKAKQSLVSIKKTVQKNNNRTF